MMIRPGDQLMIVHRRLFKEDSVRYFIGSVDEYEHGLVRITGRSFVRNDYTGDFLSKKGSMSKIFSMASGTHIIYVIPSNVNLALLRFEHNTDGEVWLKAEDDFELNLTEHHAGITAKRD